MNWIIDISPPLSAATAVFPGDVSFKRTVSMDFEKGDHLTLSSMETTLHVGAHADAPSHYHKDGVGMDEMPLERFVGKAQVVDVSDLLSEHSVQLTIDSALIKKLNLKAAERIWLWKTRTFGSPDSWTVPFAHFSPCAIECMAKLGVQTVGIDTPSVDAHDSKELLGHREIFKNQMSIIEGIVLDKVQAGTYIFMALPLKIVGGDASSVRAALIPMDQKENLWSSV